MQALQAQLGLEKKRRHQHIAKETLAREKNAKKAAEKERFVRPALDWSDVVRMCVCVYLFWLFLGGWWVGVCWGNSLFPPIMLVE